MHSGTALNRGSLSMKQDFGNVKYKGFDDWCATFGEDQKEKFPEYFSLPDGVYEIALPRPLGIVFEEVEADGRKGVFVSELVPGGNAEKSGLVSVGDLLIAVTGVKVIGAKFDRPLIQADILDYDTIIMAIGSNESKRGYDGPIMQVFFKSWSLEACISMPLLYFLVFGGSYECYDVALACRQAIMAISHSNHTQNRHFISPSPCSSSS